MPLVNNSSGPPPRKSAPKPKTSAPNPAKVQSEREDAVNGVFQMLSVGLVVANQWADAGAIEIHGPNVSRETVKLAEKYEKVGNAIDALASVGPFTAIIGAMMPLVLQIAANHKRIPAEKLGALGVKDPRILESEMRTAAQRQAYEYERSVKEEQRILNEMGMEMERERKLIHEEEERAVWEKMNKSETVPVS